MARTLELSLGVSFLTNNIRSIQKTFSKAVGADQALEFNLTLPASGTSTITVPFATTATVIVLATNNPVNVVATYGSVPSPHSFSVANILVVEDTNITQVQFTNPSSTLEVELNLFIG